MSGHLSPDTLWEAARVPPEGDDYAHLQLCPDCRLELENIKLAQGLLVEPPPPPRLSDESAKRIGNVLKQAAEKQARRSQWYGAWWPFNFSPSWVLAPLAAALLAFVAYRLNGGVPGGEQPSPLAKKDDAPVQPSVTPTPPPMPEAPHPLPPKKIVAQVKSTKNAKSGTATLKRAQELKEGSVVATAKGGSLLMALPDGSKIGLDGASQVQLAKLEDKAVTLDVDKGSMTVVARHDPSRELRVRAGDLEVYDVGTEFIVSRDNEHTLVGVEEGEVEVRAANGEAVPVRAGQAVEWRGGKLTRQQWASADELPKPKPPPPVAQRHPAPPVASAKPAADETPDIPTEPQKTPPPAAPAADQPKPTEPAATAEPTASNPDEWSTPSNLKDVPPNQPPPVPAPEPQRVPEQAPTAAPAPAAPATASEEEQDNSMLAKIQRRIKSVQQAFKPLSRIERADAISQLADRHLCNEAIAQADAWLTEAVPRGESFNTRRGVLQSKLRCLNYLGRPGDAQAVQHELDKL